MNASSTARSGSSQASTHLLKASSALTGIIDVDILFEACPVEAQVAMEIAAGSIQAALELLGVPVQAVVARSIPRMKPKALPGAPTRQQGQFLAYIQEYMNRNHAGVAPTHAALQKFFNLTPPSVNSMLTRLEQRGFISRIPGKARAIQLVISPLDIPALDRPFKM